MIEKDWNLRTWMYWEQGFENAPRLVRLCKDSWAACSDNLVALDKSLLVAYLPESDILPLYQDHIQFQIRSDLIRLKLLLKYGGIWADATVLCTRDYHDWLTDEMAPFPVLYPNTDRLISSWLVYSKPGSPSLKMLHDQLWRTVVTDKHKRWEDTDGAFIRATRRLTKSILKKIRSITGIEYWKLISILSTPAMIILLRGYPYLLIHFAYAHIVLQMKITPNKAPNFIPAADCHQLQNYLRKNARYSEEKILAILGQAPIHKLARDIDVPVELIEALNKPHGK
jgi:hypothetical protein